MHVRPRITRIAPPPTYATLCTPTDPLVDQALQLLAELRERTGEALPVEPAEVDELLAGGYVSALALERAALVLGEVRKAKSEGKRPLSTPVTSLLVQDTAVHLTALRTSLADLVSAGYIQSTELVEADAFGAMVTLASV